MIFSYMKLPFTNKIIQILLIFSIFFITVTVQAHENWKIRTANFSKVKMQIQEVNRFRHTKLLTDGTLLARVILSYDKSHIGYQVWSQNLDRSLLHENRQLLIGNSNSKNRFRVRMEVDKHHWENDPMGRGVIIYTPENQVILNIVLDGQQKVPADIYPITLNAAALASK